MLYQHLTHKAIMTIPKWSICFYEIDPESKYGFMPTPSRGLTNEEALINEFKELIPKNDEVGKEWRTWVGIPKDGHGMVWREGGGSEDRPKDF